jgi:truncated hemoglobin YjbI
MENLESWVKRVTEEFYELVYADEWLKHVFTIDQKVITSQQVDFMVGAPVDLKSKRITLNLQYTQWQFR